MYRPRLGKLAFGLSLMGCATLASCNWYDLPKGQRCCSAGVPTNPRGVRPGTEAQPTTTIANQGNNNGSNSNQGNQPCNEDEPCWNCLTMGNHICGPGAKLPNGSYANPKDDPRSYDGYGYICQVEPSQTPSGYEIIAYPVGMAPTIQGVRIPCPNQ